MSWCTVGNIVSIVTISFVEVTGLMPLSVSRFCIAAGVVRVVLVVGIVEVLFLFVVVVTRIESFGVTDNVLSDVGQDLSVGFFAHLID